VSSKGEHRIAHAGLIRAAQSTPSSSQQLPPGERLRGKLDLVAMLIALKGRSQWMYDELLLPNPIREGLPTMNELDDFRDHQDARLGS
jgi:hypothetical protein